MMERRHFLQAHLWANGDIPRRITQDGTLIFHHRCVRAAAVGSRAQSQNPARTSAFQVILRHVRELDGAVASVVPDRYVDA
jgi:hypothetical protein